MQVNETYHEWVTALDARTLVDELRAKATRRATGTHDFGGKV